MTTVTVVFVGLRRKAVPKRAAMASMAGLTRLKQKAADARKNLKTRLPPPLPLAADEPADPNGGKGLEELCRGLEAVKQGWADKVFPGEGKGFESERFKTFSGVLALAPTMLTCKMPRHVLA